MKNLKIHRWRNSKEVTIGSFCSIAGNVHILTGGNHRADWVTTFPFGILNTDVFPHDDKRQQPLSKGDVVIQDDVWIGQGAVIMSGVTIGYGAVIAAAAVVVKDVPPYAIVGGNPAKVLKYRFEPHIIERLLDLRWWDLADEQIEALVPYLCQTDADLLVRELEKVRAGTAPAKFNPIAPGTTLKQLDADSVPPAGMAVPGSIGSIEPGDPAVARFIIDGSHAALSPTPPASLLDAISEPLFDVQGAQDAMIPEWWIQEPQPAVVPSVWVLRHAHVFGGNITFRSSEGHTGGQLLVTADGAMIPASYGVLDGSASVAVDYLTPTPEGLQIGETPEGKQLKGTYYLLGNVHRHFGHNLVEGLARLWAMSLVDKRVRPEMKFLVYESALARHSLALLELAGIPADKIVFASAHDVVEHLIVPDIAMSTHRWITRLQHDVWSAMAENVEAEPAYRKVFLSRSAHGQRPLANGPAVEALFEEAGYEIVQPETLTVAEQVRLAAESVSLAGCVGSQMYLAAFQRPGAHNVVIAPRNFYLKDDVLISRANDSKLEVVLGTPIDLAADKFERTWHVAIESVAAALNTANQSLNSLVLV